MAKMSVLYVTRLRIRIKQRSGIDDLAYVELGHNFVYDAAQTFHLFFGCNSSKAHAATHINRQMHSARKNFRQSCGVINAGTGGAKSCADCVLLAHSLKECQLLL